MGDTVSQKLSSRLLKPVEGVVIVDLSFKPVALDGGAEAIVRMLGQNGASATPADRLPPEIQKVLEGSSPRELVRSTMTIETPDVQLSCTVFWMEPQDASIREPLLAVHLKRDFSISDAVRRV